MVHSDIFIGITVFSSLLIGAIFDGRKRIIPDFVPVSLFVIGIVCCFVPYISHWHTSLLERLIGFFLPASAMTALHLMKKPVGGGDFKLSAALGFLFGIYQFAVIFTASGLLALIWAGVRKQKSVPLAVFLLAGVIVCQLL